jgi:hypothetical protein
VGTGVGSHAILISICQKVEIRENLFIRCGAPTTAGTCIRGHSGGTSNGLVIVDNEIQPADNQNTWSYAVGHTQTPAACFISGNKLGPATTLGVATGVPLANQFNAAMPGQLLQASKVWDIGSVTGAAPASTTITVTGAALGDLVLVVSLSIDTGALVLTGRVSAADTVTVIASNPDSDLAGIDPASATLYVLVQKKLV